MGKRVNRKRRSDRKHLIYKVTLNTTGDSYIGITVLVGSHMKCLKSRWTRHVGRATLHPEYKWELCEAIRNNSLSDFTVEAIKIVRGKDEAHKYETHLIDTLNPTLNTFKKGFDKLSKVKHLNA